MAINKNKIVALAQKYTAKGQFEKAIVEYQRVLGAEPSDIRTWLKIGDLYTRMGARKEAMDTYLKVAKEYTKSGFHLKAVAVYKQVLKLDPTLLEIHQFLADSYSELGLTSEVLIHLEQLADMYQRTNHMELLLGVLMRMGEIDPHNIATRLRIAEYLSKENRVPEAVEHFAIACEELKKQGRVDDFLKVGERLLFHDASRVEVAREIAGVYLERSQFKDALAKLQGCFATNPRDFDTLELLVHAFRGLGQPDKAVSVYKEMCVLLSEPEDEERRNYCYQAILALDPKNPFALRALGNRALQPANSVSSSKPEASADAQPKTVSAVRAISDTDPDAGVDEYEDVLEIADGDLEEIDDLGDLTHVDVLSVDELSVQDVDKRIEEIISETDVLIKYGLTDRALDHIQKVFDLDTYNIDARERMKDILLDIGRIDEALDQLFMLADVFRDSQPEGAVYYLHEVLRIDPDNVRARELIVALGGIMPEDLDNLSSDGRFDGEMNTGAEVEGLEVLGDDMLEMVDQGTSNLQESDLDIFDVKVIESGIVGDDDLESAVLESAKMDVSDARHYGFETGEPDEPTSVFTMSVIDGISPAEPVSKSEPDEGVPDFADNEGPDIKIVDSDGDSFEQEPAPNMVVGEPDRTPSPPDIDDELEEVNFYLSQGLVDEAEALIKDLVTSYPNDPRVQDVVENVKTSRLSDDPAGIPDETEMLSSLVESDFPLDELETSDRSSDFRPSELSGIMRSSKVDVQNEISDNDYATHYDLGIAYKEMGLVEDAISEFTISSQDPRKVALSKTMIGMCLKDLGREEEAVRMYLEGLKTSNIEVREKHGLLYELGVTYQMMGKRTGALKCFRKIHSVDPKFADVATRIAELSGSSVPAPRRGVFG